MKRFLFFVALIVVAAIVFVLMQEDEPGTAPRGSMRSSRDDTVRTTPTPYPTPVLTATPQPTRVYTPRPTPRQTVVRRTPSSPRSYTDNRSAEIRKIIFDCARRARWEILDYKQPTYGVSRVTGWYPSGDHVRGIRFLDEVEKSGIIMDIDGGRTGRPGRNRQGRPGVISTITIKWR